MEILSQFITAVRRIQDHYPSAVGVVVCCYKQGAYYNFYAQSRHHYLNDKQHGRYLQLNTDFTKFIECNHFNGLHHGPQYHWYSNGKLSYESHYQHGLRHGVSRNWDCFGQLWYEEWYDNGVCISKTKF